jgi:photosystem II stability/assembly factor-like uncharacterized protein
MSPTDPDRVFFGGHAGLQESQDGGFTWTTGTLIDTDAMNIAISPVSPESVYVAGHDVFQMSQDAGLSWQPVDHDLPSTDIHAFAQDPKQPERFYAFVVGAGVYTSADGGLSWRVIQTQPGEGYPVALASDGDRLYAAMPLGLMVSMDQGGSWTPTSAQPQGGAISVAIDASNARTLFVGTTTGIAKSTDGGQSWKTIALTGAPVVSITVAPANPNRLLAVALNGSVYRSDDAGSTWNIS